MRYLLAIAYTGLVAILQYPLRSAVTIVCVVAILLPYVAGLGISKGLEQEAEDSVRFGADLYVSGLRFGREEPVPVQVTYVPALGASTAGLLAAPLGQGMLGAAGAFFPGRGGLAEEIRQVDGVSDVVPRIVARFTVGKNNEEVVLVGIPAGHLPESVTCVAGRLPQTRSLNEVVVGTELAKRLGLHPDSTIRPFYHSSRGDHLSKVVGIFKSDVPIWQSSLMLTTFETAGQICNQEELATDLLVYCRPGYRDSVRAAILRSQSLPSPTANAPMMLKVTSRDDLQVLVGRGLLNREGIFNLLFLVAFAVGILTLLVTSGIGTAERRREIGILKATGWQTDEILLRSLVESFLLSLAGAALALILAWVWLRPFNGYWIGSVFLAGLDVKPGIPVPFRLTPVPAILCFLVSSILVMSGTLYSTWRAAIVAPREAIR